MSEEHETVAIRSAFSFSLCRAASMPLNSSSAYRVSQRDPLSLGLAFPYPI